MENLLRFSTRWAHVSVLELMLGVMLREGVPPTRCYIDCDDMDAYNGRAHLEATAEEGKRIINIIDREFPPYHDYRIINNYS